MDRRTAHRAHDGAGVPTLMSAVHMGEPDWPWVESQLCSTTWLLGSSLWNIVRGQVVDHMLFSALSSGKPVQHEGRQPSATELHRAQGLGTQRSVSSVCTSQAVVPKRKHEHVAHPQW